VSISAQRTILDEKANSQVGQTRPFHIHLAVKKGRTKMTCKQDSAERHKWSQEFREGVN